MAHAFTDLKQKKIIGVATILKTFTDRWQGNALSRNDGSTC
jgi:hypothetical protein